MQSNEPLQERDHRVVQYLIQIMWLYSGYPVRSRGPIGLLLDAIEELEPETAKRIRSGEAGDDWSGAADMEED